MKPLILKDVADAIGMHESTVSRVTNSKLILTDWGLLSLKEFFSAAIPSSEESDKHAASAVREALKKLIATEVSSKPLIIADVAHNEEAFKEVICEVQKIKSQKKMFVLGFVKDKPINKIIKLLHKEGIYFFSSPKISRAYGLEHLNSILENTEINYRIFESVEEAYNIALSNATKEDFIFVGGSNFTVSEILDH